MKVNLTFVMHTYLLELSYLKICLLSDLDVSELQSQKSTNFLIAGANLV